MSIDGELPTTKFELERKVVDFMDGAANRVRLGDLGEQDLCLMSSALWYVTSGLVDKAVSEICSVGARELKPRKVQRILTGRGVVVFISWTTDLISYSVETFNAVSGATSLKSKTCVAGELRGELATLFATLLRGGYSVIDPA